MLESGKVTSLREIARKDQVDSSYVCRMVNLTTLAPKIVVAILDETVPPDVTLFDLAVDPPALWEEQRNRIKGMMPRSRAADRSGGYRPIQIVRHKSRLTQRS